MQVSITDECISCGVCEIINPDIFIVDKKANVNCKCIKDFEDDCIDAALICPVNAICIDEIS